MILRPTQNKKQITSSRLHDGYSLALSLPLSLSVSPSLSLSRSLSLSLSLALARSLLPSLSLALSLSLSLLLSLALVCPWSKSGFLDVLDSRNTPVTATVDGILEIL